MKKRIKPEAQLDILTFINADKYRPVDQQLGIESIIINVKVSDYQKKRYFIMLSNLKGPITHMLSQEGRVNFLKIATAKIKIENEVVPFRKGIDEQSLLKMDNALRDVLNQVKIFLAYHGTSDEVHFIYNMLKNEMDNTALERIAFDFDPDFIAEEYKRNELLELFSKRLKQLQNIVEPTSKPKEYKVLSDLWSEDCLQYYDEIISELLTYSTTIDNSFIVKKGDGYLWNYCYGRDQYISGFLYQLMKKGWIKDSFSARILQNVINSTFSLEIRNQTVFQPGYRIGLNEKYIKPFSFIKNRPRF